MSDGQRHFRRRRRRRDSQRAPAATPRRLQQPAPPTRVRCSPPGARPSGAPHYQGRSLRTSPRSRRVRRPHATGARALRVRSPGSISPSPRSSRRTRPPASTRRAPPPDSALTALLLTSELRRVLATPPAMLASRDNWKRPACVGWASLAPASARGRREFASHRSGHHPGALETDRASSSII